MKHQGQLSKPIQAMQPVKQFLHAGQAMQAPLHTHSLKLNPSRPCTRDPNPQSTRVRCGGPAPHHTGKLLRLSNPLSAHSKPSSWHKCKTSCNWNCGNP
eukprot:1160717-Pelagomonas_calceolata.AAC.16